MKKDLSPDVWMTTSEMDADSRRTEEELKKPEFAENHIRAFLKVSYKAWKENQKAYPDDEYPEPLNSEEVEGVSEVLEAHYSQSFQGYSSKVIALLKKKDGSLVKVSAIEQYSGGSFYEPPDYGTFIEILS